MNDFIEECHREWRRLRVPDPVAAEMAAELAADLDEAAAEGASAEDVLGSGVFDPRTFAASWAAERGVIPPAPVRRRFPSRPLVVAGVVAVTAIAVVGAALAIFASPRDAAPATLDLAIPGPPFAVRVPAPPPPAMSNVPVAVTVDGRQIITADGAATANGSGVDVHMVGSILLTVGMVGVILSMLFLFWSSSVRRVDRPPHGPGYS